MSRSWLPVTGLSFSVYEKNGATSVLATYDVGPLTLPHWLFPGCRRLAYARLQSDVFWLDHGGADPFPTTAEEFVSRSSELLRTARVEIERSGRRAFITAISAKGDAA